MGVVMKRSISERAREISYKRGIPLVTAETVCKDLLKSFINSAENLEDVLLDGLTSIKAIQDVETGEYYVRGRVSSALQQKLKQKHG